MGTKGILAGVMLCAVSATPAQAAQYLVKFTGTANIAIDQYNLFGGLTGLHAFTATYSVDDTKGATFSFPQVSGIYGGYTYPLSQPISAVLSIGGQSLSFGGGPVLDSNVNVYDEYSGIELDEVYAQIFEYANFDPDADTTSLSILTTGIYSESNNIVSTSDFRAPFFYNVAPGDIGEFSSFERYVIKASTGEYLMRTSVAFNFATVSIEQVVSPVPEAPTWAMMITGFGLTGGVMRRRKVRTTVSYA